MKINQYGARGCMVVFSWLGLKKEKMMDGNFGGCTICLIFIITISNFPPSNKRCFGYLFKIIC